MIMIMIMGIDLVDKDDVENEDIRNAKRKYLLTDAICCECGTVINAYYEDECLVCNCGGKSFITGKVSVDIRLLIDFHIEELKAICEIHGVSMTGGRSKMVVEVLREIYGINKVRIDNRINERLVRKIIARNNRKFWFVRDIEDAIIKVRYSNITLVDEKDMKIE